MKQKRCVLLLLMLLGVLIVGVASADTLWVKTPNGKTVNLREGPSLDDDILTRVPYGEAVYVTYDILGSSFLHVEYNGYNGYIQARYLVDYDPGSSQPKPTAKPSSSSISYKSFRPSLYIGSVVPSNPSTYVNMRWAPSLSADVHDIYYNGQTLLVIAVGDEWSQVYDLEQNTCGFMMNRFLSYCAPYDGGAVGSAN